MHSEEDTIEACASANARTNHIIQGIDKSQIEETKKVLTIHLPLFSGANLNDRAYMLTSAGN